MRSPAWRRRRGGGRRRWRRRTAAASRRGGAAWRREATVAATNSGGGSKKIGQHLPVVCSPPRSRCVRGKEKGLQLYGWRVIGPGPCHRPGPMTHWSRAMARPGTDDLHLMRAFPLWRGRDSSVPGDGFARDQ